MATIPEALTLAIQHHQGGRLDEAEQIYRQILAVDPDHADSLHLLGVLAYDVGWHGLAFDLIQRAIALNTAEGDYHCNLGNVLQALGKSQEAITCYQRALELNPNQAEALNNLGDFLREQGKLDLAVAYCRRALELDPKLAAAHNNLGNALYSQEKLDEAVACFLRALELDPKLAAAHNNLGNALHSQEKLDEAVACFRRALQLQPDLAATHSNLGNVFQAQGKTEPAISCYHRALELQPDFIEANYNLGNTLKNQGKLDEAIACFRQAIKLGPDHVKAHDNLLLALLYWNRADAFQLARSHAEFNQRFGIPLATRNISHANDRSPNRRLRIGYVSPDFCGHVVGRNVWPVFRKHDREQFEVFAYAQMRHRDAYTDYFQACSDAWRGIVGLSDESLAQKVREDRIDILVDLTLHTADNRLLALARKPAPVQVTFAGYPGTTGLTAIDYRLTDPYLDPPGLHDECYSEQSFRLPSTFWCYEPVNQETPVSPLPAGEQGYVTFGCLNSFCKVNDSVLRLWARVLRNVEGSRLVLHVPEGATRQETLKRLEQEGVVPERAVLVSRQSHQKYLELYHQIDIGLDTLPYNGHTTSLDSYWMGVPVITLVGQTVVGRAGLSQLTNLKLTELIAYSPAEFVKIAVELAQDLPRLAALRATLRQRMKASPLMDAQGFTRGIEAAYRTMWRRWCEQQA